MKLSRSILGAVHAKTQSRCWYCGSSIPPFSNWQVEHQIPRSKGGSDEIENLVPSCPGCNTRKGGRTIEEYRRSLSMRLENAATETLELALELGPFMESEALGLITEKLLSSARLCAEVRLTFYGEREEQPAEIQTHNLEVIS